MIRDQSLFHGPIWRPWLRRLAAAALVFATAPVLAHHSAAFFDLSKPVTLHGTVKELQWTNPHCFIQLLVPEEGKVVEWSLEMHAPVVMYRRKLSDTAATQRPGTQRCEGGRSLGLI